MKRILSGAGLLSALLVGVPFGVANAADMAVKVPYAAPAAVWDWGGLYGGFNFGGEFGKYTANSPIACPAGGVACYGAPTLASMNSVAATSWPARGVMLGLEGGYNVQVNGIVAGIEVDFESADLRAVGQTSSALPVGAVYNNTLSTNWMGTARGRLGFVPQSNWLFFGTAGIAVTDLHYTHTFTDFTPDVESSTGSRTASGLVWGGGFEWEPLLSRISIKAEYLHAAFPSVSMTGNVITAGAPTSNVFYNSGKLTADIVRFGVNYHLGGGPVPVATKD